MFKKIYFYASWLFVAGWMGLIFYLSSQPAEDIPSFMPDYLAHGIEYFILAALLVNSFQITPKLTHNIHINCFIITFLYGISDEIHQVFIPTRTFSIIDIAADAAGVIIAISLYKLLIFMNPGLQNNFVEKR
ncbi:MAG: VanZ family protein [Actinomycetia bacterium]|nr:VanZ family protein [Actinomycetes bacterium]